MAWVEERGEKEWTELAESLGRRCTSTSTRTPTTSTLTPNSTSSTSSTCSSTSSTSKPHGLMP